jgi:hypothetical protein
MKGLELSQLVGIILVLIVIVIVVIVVIQPAMLFGKSTEERRGFEEFCVFWGVNGFKQDMGESVIVGTDTYSVTQMCTQVLKSSSPDKDTCVKCCQKVIVC